MGAEHSWSDVMHAVPEWFQDAKFGLFFHWGPYCVPSYENEWYSRNMYKIGSTQSMHHIETYGELRDFGYKDFFDDFTGANFNADRWADLVEKSGAKYAGPVAEHADNFSMWNSHINPINAVNYGPKRDVVDELRIAFKRRGIRFLTSFHHQWLWGWFMSTDPDADVYVPENERYYGKALPIETSRYRPWRLPDSEFNTIWLQKVEEVIDKYQPDLIYFDSRSNIIGESFRHRILSHYYSHDRGGMDCIISYKQDDFPEGTGIRDIECGTFADIQAFTWQTDDRLEAKRTWCYVDEPLYRSGSEIIRQLCDIVSKNGNLLLNVGPRKDGTFAKEAEESLIEVGDWLRVCGEAIYGTRPFTVFGEGSHLEWEFDISKIEEQTRKGTFVHSSQLALVDGDLRFTTKNNILYIIIAGRPMSTPLIVHSLGHRKGNLTRMISTIDVVGGESNIDWGCSEEGLTVRYPCSWPFCSANVLRVTLRN